MSTPHFITTDAGEELVILSRRQYDALSAAQLDQAAEDEGVRRAVAAHRSEPTAALPLAVWDEIAAGENPVRAIRKARGLSQVELADRVGVGQADISKLERGVRADLPVSLAKKLAEALKVAVTDIVGD